MPVIIVESNPVSTEKKRKLVKEMTKIASEIYELPEDTVTILIRELEREDIGVGGKLLLDLDE
ncbi:tautomerase family protein [Methanobrevibacter sp. TMH8]|uniref:4-oxalocrotonate tautomerase DmpI n=1 Tax=Methanobrevibacter sp. TMH8 TaxID=2848611 RepID=UPI001CCB1F05|nr:4-oxalocrotonate tautomerase DmpI [Methanobrevibacter sp. TMH8]MBZ9570114.1 tautomerase family protein [Methanobrevibacter sp. TMH8]